MLRSYLYDAFIVDMTSKWYRHVLSLVPPRSSVLDVGIGTASSLLKSRDIVISKRLRVVGVDYDSAYVSAAERNVAALGMTDQISLTCADIHKYDGGPFDIIYFSGSFMIIPDKVAALRRCCKMLRSDGRLFFTQTFEKRHVLRWLTPLIKATLKVLLTIDFGDVTYEDDFFATLAAADVSLVQKKVTAKGWLREEVLIIAKPA